MTTRDRPPGDYSGGPKTGQPPSRLSLATKTIRWAWRLDDAAKRLTVVTGRWAARAVFRDLHRKGES